MIHGDEAATGHINWGNDDVSAALDLLLIEEEALARQQPNDSCHPTALFVVTNAGEVDDTARFDAPMSCYWTGSKTAPAQGTPAQSPTIALAPAVAGNYLTRRDMATTLCCHRGQAIFRSVATLVVFIMGAMIATRFLTSFSRKFPWRWTMATHEAAFLRSDRGPRNISRKTD